MTKLDPCMQSLVSRDLLGFRLFIERRPVFFWLRVDVGSLWAVQLDVGFALVRLFFLNAIFEVVIKLRFFFCMYVQD